MKPRKHKTPRQKLIKDCDTLFSKIIRKRDPICVYCGKRPSQDAAHIFSTGDKMTPDDIEGKIRW